MFKNVRAAAVPSKVHMVAEETEQNLLLPQGSVQSMREYAYNTYTYHHMHAYAYIYIYIYTYTHIHTYRKYTYPGRWTDGQSLLFKLNSNTCIWVTIHSHRVICRQRV